MGRSQENQWLGELQGGAKALGNPQFSADATTPGGLVLALRRTEGDR
jgi:hypothetical protein